MAKATRISVLLTIALVIFAGASLQGCGQAEAEMKRLIRPQAKKAIKREIKKYLANNPRLLAQWLQQQPINDDGRMPIYARHDAVELRVFVNWLNGSWEDGAKVREILADPEFVTQCERVGVRLRSVNAYYDSVAEPFDVLITLRQPREMPDALGCAELWQYWQDDVGDVSIRIDLRHEKMFRVLLHEVGHLIGAGHSGEITDVMWRTTEGENKYAWSDYEAERIAAFTNGNLPLVEPRDLPLGESHFRFAYWDIATVTSTVVAGERIKPGRLGGSKNPSYVYGLGQEDSFAQPKLYFYSGLLGGKDPGPGRISLMFRATDEQGNPVGQSYGLGGEWADHRPGNIGASEQRIYFAWLPIGIVGRTTITVYYLNYATGEYVLWDDVSELDSAGSGPGTFSVSMQLNEDGTASLVFD